MTARRVAPRLAVVLVVVALLGAAACGDDDDPSSKTEDSTTTTDKSSGTGGDEGSSSSTSTTDEGAADDSGDDGATTVPIADELRGRLPDLDGYTRDDGDDSFDLNRCGGGSYSVTPVGQANADYTPESASGSNDHTAQTTLFGGLRFADAAAAGTFYDEVTASIPKCVSDEEEIGDAETLDIDDEAVLYPVSRGGKPESDFALARHDDEVWLLVAPVAEGADSVDQELIDAFQQAVEG